MKGRNLIKACQDPKITQGHSATALLLVSSDFNC